MIEPVMKESARIEAFSDGVFAIAITLLILEIRLPHDLAPGALGRGLVELWPSYLAYLASFLTIGVMWINHHRLFDLIHRADQALLGLNLLLLLGVSVVPFPTAVVAAHITGPDARTAALCYSGWFVLIAIFFNVLWRYASHEGRLLGDHVDHKEVHGISRQYSFGPVYYLVACIVAMFSPTASVIFNLMMAIFFALPARHFHRQH